MTSNILMCINNGNGNNYNNGLLICDVMWQCVIINV